AQGESASPWVTAASTITSPRTRGRQRVAHGESASPWVTAHQPHKPAYSRAAACSPGRVREPLGHGPSTTQARVLAGGSEDLNRNKSIRIIPASGPASCRPRVRGLSSLLRSA